MPMSSAQTRSLQVTPDGKPALPPSLVSVLGTCYASAMVTNLLYYGDNLEVLRRYVKDKSVDLVYLDPPFNSNATYNVLFAEQNGTRAAAQIKAFGDTWRWDQEAAREY